VLTLLSHDLQGVDRIGATTGGLPLQRMKQPCLIKGALKTPLIKGGVGGILSSMTVRKF